MRDTESRYWEHVTAGCMTEESDDENGEKIVTHQLLWRSECEFSGSVWAEVHVPSIEHYRHMSIISPNSSYIISTATSPSLAYVSNPVLDSSLCRAAVPQLHPLQLLLPDCIDLLQLLLTVCVRFGCCSLIASTSTAAPRLHRSASTAAHPLQLLLPDCVRFSCCSLIASTSTAAP